MKMEMKEILEGLKRTMEKQVQGTEEMFNRIKELQEELDEQEEQLFLLEAMKAQLQASIKENQEELKVLREKRDKMKMNKYTMTESELKQMRYDKEQQNLRLAVKSDKTEDDYKMMKQLDKEIKEIIRVLENF